MTTAKSVIKELKENQNTPTVDVDNRLQGEAKMTRIQQWAALSDKAEEELEKNGHFSHDRYKVTEIITEDTEIKIYEVVRGSAKLHFQNLNSVVDYLIG